MNNQPLKTLISAFCAACLAGGALQAQEEALDLGSALAETPDAAQAATEESGPGDNKRFTIRTDDNVSALEIGDIYRNDTKTFFKVVEINSKTPKGGKFVVERTAGSTDPERKFTRVSGVGPSAISARATLLDLYLAGGFIMHPLLLMGFLTIVLALNCAWIFRTKLQCSQTFVDSAWKALQKRDLAQFSELSQKTQGLFPAICRALVDRWDTSTVEDIESRAVTAASAQINRLRMPVKALNLIAAAAPLVGLLGTIIGMVLVFEAVAGATGAAKAQALASGIRVKLFCTAMALGVAIPALFSYFFFNQMLGSLISHCETLTEQFVHQIKFLKRKFGSAEYSSPPHEHSVHFSHVGESTGGVGIATAVTDQSNP